MQLIDTAFFYKRMKMDIDTGCWEWQKVRNSKGYGKVVIDGKNFQAHRKSYEHFVGPIPEGLEMDHLCSNPCCINPKHLEPVTQLENSNRAYDRRHPQ